MAKLKPYISTTQSLPSISNRTFPFPISKFNIDYHLHNPKPFPISQFHPTQKPQQIIVCAKKQQWSNRKMIQLASRVAFNLKILPEPFNSFLGQIARTNSNENRILNRLIGGARVKSNKNKKKFLLPVFVLICVADVIWTRNDFVFKLNKTPANDVVHLILQQVEDTKQASRMSNSVESERHCRRNTLDIASQVESWIPPDEDWIKINRDGTVVQYGLKAVGGGVTHKGDKWKICFGVFS
ncbi:hypothetical protein P8452_23054 [Trifolium repens]|nr:hypothetical protein P8452_23054 [Trifolium repens]